MRLLVLKYCLDLFLQFRQCSDNNYLIAEGHAKVQSGRDRNSGGLKCLSCRMNFSCQFKIIISVFGVYIRVITSVANKKIPFGITIWIFYVIIFSDTKVLRQNLHNHLQIAVGTSSFRNFCAFLIGWLHFFFFFAKRKAYNMYKLHT